MSYFGFAGDPKKEQLKAAKCAAQGGQLIDGPPDKKGNPTRVCSGGSGGGGGGAPGGSGDTGDGKIFGLPPLAIIGGLAAIGLVASQLLKKKAA